MCRTNSQPSAPDADDVITADERIQKLRQRIRTIRNLKSRGRPKAVSPPSPKAVSPPSPKAVSPPSPKAVSPPSQTRKRLAKCFIEAVSNFYKEM